MKVPDVKVRETVEVNLKLARTAYMGTYENIDFLSKLYTTINEFCERYDVYAEDIKVSASISNID